jgi:hypothetical protein
VAAASSPASSTHSRGPPRTPTKKKIAQEFTSSAPISNTKGRDVVPSRGRQSSLQDTEETMLEEDTNMPPEEGIDDADDDGDEEDDDENDEDDKEETQVRAPVKASKAPTPALATALATALASNTYGAKKRKGDTVVSELTESTKRRGTSGSVMPSLDLQVVKKTTTPSTGSTVRTAQPGTSSGGGNMQVR